MFLKMFFDVHTNNTNSATTLISAAFGGTFLPTEVAGIPSREEFDENDGFFTTSCDPYTSHTDKLFKNLFPEKECKGWF